MQYIYTSQKQSLITRAPFIAILAAATGFLAARLSAQTLPAPDASGIEHIIVVTMENRSFDHFLGWLPHADGRQEDLTFLDRNCSTSR